MALPVQPKPHLQNSLTQTWALSIGISVLILAIIEILLRIPSVQSALPAPGYDANSPELSIKIARLDHQISQLGTIDCILMGSSVMDADGNVEALSRAYTATTRQQTTCYNFALAGMSPTEAPTVAHFLLARYRPRTLVYGIGALELSDDFTNRENGIYQTPWISYIGGKYSLQGWFFNTLYIARNLSLLKYYSDYQARTTYQGFARILTTSGQEARSPVYNYHPLDKVEYPDFIINQTAFAGFVSLLQLANTENFQLIVVEEPIHPAFLAHDNLEDGLTGYYDRFQVPVEAACKPASICIDSQAAVPPLPAIGWADARHLNKIGAQIFSAWLGQKIGQLMLQGQLRPLGH